MQAQYEHFLPIAQHAADCNRRQSSLVAWQEALAMCKRKGLLTGKWCHDVLERALQLWAAASVTTSGLEQSVATAERLFGPRRHAMGPQLRNHIHEFVTDDNAGPDRETIIHEAPGDWAR